MASAFRHFPSYLTLVAHECKQAKPPRTTSPTPPTLLELWGCSGVVVTLLDFRSEGWWFETQSLPSCFFLRQETKLTHIVSLHRRIKWVSTTYCWGV